MTDTARLSQLSIHRVDNGQPGYKLENAFGQSVQVLPRPPAFRATLVLEWEGGNPEEIDALIERARAAGIAIGE